MNRVALALALTSVLAAPCWAQVAPAAALDDPRVQTVGYNPAQPVRLVGFPGAILTVMLIPGDKVTRATVSDGSAFEVRVVGDNDVLNIAPQRPDADATLLVETSARRYEIDLATGAEGAAAHLVRFVALGTGFPASPLGSSAQSAAAERQRPPTMIGKYRLSGDQVLLPSSIGDDGQRTYLTWGEYQSMPAVFGIGPTGEEEVVPGYMREGVFTIDRIYSELIFRIDEERAEARRLSELGGL